MKIQTADARRHPSSRLLFIDVAKAHPIQNPGQNDHPFLPTTNESSESIQKTIHRSSVRNSLEVKKYTGTNAVAKADHNPARFE